MNKRKELEEAIAALETQRSVLGDTVIDSAISAMQKQLDEILEKQEPFKQQRKLITVLFVDIVSSTKLMHELDPEENLSIMDTVLQQLAEPVKTHGGRVTRFMGDGYLAIFGLPIAKENDPEMAVRAGLDILNVAKIIGSQLENNKNLSGFQVRVGINTGLVVTGGVTEGENTVMGNAVNLASRLESLASPNSLLISQYTYQHVHGLFDVEPIDPIFVKGFSEPIQVYLVKKVKKTHFRMKTRGIEGIEVPMVGREKEFNTLKKTFETGLQRKESQFITIIGEAGLGKSRLLYEFENWLTLQSTNFELFKGRTTLEILETPYGLLRDLMSSRFGILEDDLISIVKTKVVNGFREILGDIKNLEMNSLIVGQILGYNFRDNIHIQSLLDNPKQLQYRAFLHLIKYFKQLAIEKPVIIFLDDIHWADESSLDILLRLSHETPNQQIFVVALSRPTLFERRSAWGNERFHQLISLQPLSSIDSQHMVREVLQKVKHIPDNLSKLIVSNAEGNPYYLEEMVKMLLEEEVIIRGADYWMVVPERLTDLHIPATLTGVLQSRLDHLSVADRTILQQAAVVGRIFWDDVIFHINESQDFLKDMSIEEILTSLNNRELILIRETSVFANVMEYMFKHTMLREVTYESVLKRTRQVYHKQVAEWLIKHSGERVDEVAGLIAKHLEIAGNKKEALMYIIKAAESALSKYALEEADGFYTRALALTPDNDIENQYTLIVGKERILGLQGNRAKQREILEKLVSLVEAMEDGFKKVEVQILKAWFAYWTSDFSEMLTVAGEALTSAQVINDQNLIQRSNYTIAWALIQLDDIENALNHAQEGLFQARELNDRIGEGSLLNTLGLIKMSQGDYPSARNYLEGFLSIAKDNKDQDSEKTALNNLGVSHTKQGKFASARNYYQQFNDIATEIGDQVSISTSFINLAWVTSAQGEWENALQYAEKGIAMKREFEQADSVAEGLVWMGHSWLGLNEPKKAFNAYNEALIIRRKLNQTSLAMGALAGLARVALMQNDFSSAQAYNEEIMTYLKEGGTLEGVWEPLRIYLTCVQVFQAVDDPRSKKILTEAYELLQSNASKIPDSDERKIFLEEIPWHKKILDLWNLS
ncbi:MAG: adenylate/guanylate cyclase domain-containing protein [Candidatus Hodarchaeales archaeon]|jgi:predicted ATPase/class 3 adenylate cyclase